MADSTNTNVNRGQLTFNSEGNNVFSSHYYSRVIHFPERGISGVTIGRGYDMGTRSQRQIYSDLVTAGVSHTQAQALSQAARLRGKPAADFVRQQRNIIGEITEQQQAALFNLIYPQYEQRTKAVYNTRTENMGIRPEWNTIHPAIRDVLVDMIYQGFRGETAMSAAAANDIDSFINYIRQTPSLMSYEPGRDRIGYLESNRGTQ